MTRPPSPGRPPKLTELDVGSFAARRHAQQAVVRQGDGKVHGIGLVLRVLLQERDGLWGNRSSKVSFFIRWRSGLPVERTLSNCPLRSKTWK